MKEENKDIDKGKIDGDIIDRWNDYFIGSSATASDIAQWWLDVLQFKIEEAYEKGLKQGDWNAETLKTSYESGRIRGVKEENKRVAEIVGGKKENLEDADDHDYGYNQALQDILKAITKER